MSPFDFVKQIQKGKQNLLIDEGAEKGYVPFIINRALSLHLDCLPWAQEMNQRPGLDKRLQHDYLMRTVRSRNRPYEKWMKRAPKEDVLAAIALKYECSMKVAVQYTTLLSEQAKKELIQWAEPVLGTP